MTVPEPGELYWVHAGSERPRPYIVVSRRVLNRGDYVVVVPLTSSDLDRRWHLPNAVPFCAGQFNLPKDCVAQCEGITYVEKEALDLATGPFARLTEEVWRDLVRAIGNVICAECEPA